MIEKLRLPIAAALVAVTACISPPVAPLIVPTSATLPSPTSSPAPSPTHAFTPTSTSSPTPIPKPTPAPFPSPTSTLEPAPTYTPIPFPSPTSAPTAQTPATLEAKLTETPTTEPTKEAKYYTQQREVYGIRIKAGSKVAPEALEKAVQTLEMMLRGREDIAERLAKSGTELAIIPKDEYMTTLPEFMSYVGKVDPNGNLYNSFKVRGVGAKDTQLTTLIPEETLLGLATDPFTMAGDDVTVHEFGHAVMNFAFTPEDNKKLKKIYDDAKKANLFPEAFAMTSNSIDEFFAEMTQSYFDRNNEIGNAQTIKEKASDMFKFLEEIYGTLPQSFIMPGDGRLVLRFASPITAATANGYGTGSCRKIQDSA